MSLLTKENYCRELGNSTCTPNPSLPLAQPSHLPETTTICLWIAQQAQTELNRRIDKAIITLHVCSYSRNYIYYRDYIIAYTSIVYDARCTRVHYIIYIQYYTWLSHNRRETQLNPKVKGATQCAGGSLMGTKWTGAVRDRGERERERGRYNMRNWGITWWNSIIRYTIINILKLIQKVFYSRRIFGIFLVGMLKKIWIYIKLKIYI